MKIKISICCHQSNLAIWTINFVPLNEYYRNKLHSFCSATFIRLSLCFTLKREKTRKNNCFEKMFPIQLLSYKNSASNLTIILIENYWNQSNVINYLKRCQVWAYVISNKKTRLKTRIERFTFRGLTNNNYAKKANINVTTWKVRPYHARPSVFFTRFFSFGIGHASSSILVS